MHCAFLLATCLLVPAASWHTPLVGSPHAKEQRLTTVHFAGGGFGASKAKSKAGGKKKKQQQKKEKPAAAGGGGASSSFEAAASRDPAAAKRIMELYGGDIQKGTVARITAAREALAAADPPLAEAMSLRQEKIRFDAAVAKLTLLQQASVPPEQWEQARRRDARLEALEEEHGVTSAAVHNAFQRLTWDASAEAKAFRASADLSKDMEGRLDRALRFAAEAAEAELPPEVTAADRAAANGGTSSSSSSSSRREERRRLVCDVGAGTGVLVPAFERSGVPVAAVVGVDLSPEMTKVAARAHPRATFLTADFLSFDGVDPCAAELAAAGPARGGEREEEEEEEEEEGGGGVGVSGGGGGGDGGSLPLGGSCFDAVVFCMALHDLPDPSASLRRARHLVRPGGKVVVAHPRGAAHVAMQHRKSPEMVPNVLPSAADLEELCAEQPAEGGDDERGSSSTATFPGKKLRLELAPAAPGSPDDKANGYLAVLEAYLD